MEASRAPMNMRAFVPVFAACLLAVQVVRSAAVSALSQMSPSDAARFWPVHPAVQISAAMRAVASAAGEGGEASSSGLAALAQISAKEPLAAEPFLIHARQAQLSGDSVGAQRSFEAAQWRDPSSLPAAYFLADHYFHAGDVDHALQQIGLLERGGPAGARAAAPYLRAYAENASTWAKLRTWLQANASLRGVALVSLASNLATVKAALALADPKKGALASPWFASALQTLVDAGDYEEARRLWRQAAGEAPSRELLYDSSFSDAVAPPPFNWSLANSTVGRAQRQSGGRLHLVFYGQEDGFLASQLLLLTPGSYRLSMQIAGRPPSVRTFSWSIWCDKSAEPLGSTSFEAIATQSWTFAVPLNCSAQWLRLGAAISGNRKPSEVTIASLRLQRVAAHE